MSGSDWYGVAATLGTLVLLGAFGLVVAEIAVRRGHGYTSWFLFGAMMFIVALPLVLTRQRVGHAAKRFSPPPGWPPVPKDWRPPPEWQPDPAWPSPPPGWIFWTDAEPWATPRSLDRNWWLVAAVVTAGLLALVSLNRAESTPLSASEIESELESQFATGDGPMDATCATDRPRNGDVFECRVYGGSGVITVNVRMTADNDYVWQQAS